MEAVAQINDITATLFQRRLLKERNDAPTRPGKSHEPLPGLAMLHPSHRPPLFLTTLLPFFPNR